MNQKELKTILDNHARQVNNDGGERANLIGADLRKADLRESNLSGAKLQLPDIYVLKDQPPNTKLIAFKFLTSELKSPFEEFQYEVGKVYSTNDYSDDERVTCDKGFNVATRQWCERNMGTGSVLIRVSFYPKDIVAIPYATDGKFRVKRMKIEEVLN